MLEKAHRASTSSAETKDTTTPVQPLIAHPASSLSGDCRVPDIQRLQLTDIATFM